MNHLGHKVKAVLRKYDLGTNFKEITIFLPPILFWYYENGKSVNCVSFATIERIRVAGC